MVIKFHLSITVKPLKTSSTSRKFQLYFLCRILFKLFQQYIRIYLFFIISQRSFDMQESFGWVKSWFLACMKERDKKTDTHGKGNLEFNLFSVYII